VADPVASVALRVINATSDTVDASFRASTAAEATAATGTWANIPPMTVAAYQTAAPAIYLYKATQGATRVADHAAALAIGNMHRRALQGAAAVTVAPGPFDAVPGSEVAGSAVTGIVFPRSVLGTQAPQGTGSASIPSWQGSAITFAWDRRPPRPAGV
jgi:hypothetical protein